MFSTFNFLQYLYEIDFMKNWKDGRIMVDVKCEHCQSLFKKTLSEYNRSEKNSKKHFCSLKCSHEHKKNNSPRYCKQCGKLIELSNNRNIFCSQNCAGIFNGKKRIGIKYNVSEQGLINLRKSASSLLNKNVLTEIDNYYLNPNHCKECGTILTYKKRNHIFCGIGCKRKNDKKNLTEYQKYYKNCQFQFNLSDYPNEFDFGLINKYGWYQAKNHGNNLNGISRDHMISVKFGYENNINPEIIKHPANCRLMQHSENSSKWKTCSITLKELIVKINNWNLKYNMPH